MATDSKSRKTMSSLEQLQEFTTVVADTGEISAIKEYAAVLPCLLPSVPPSPRAPTRYTPTDATTNPSLLLKAAELDEYSSLVEDAVKRAKESGLSGKDQLEFAMDQLSVNFGLEILKIVPGT